MGQTDSFVKNSQHIASELISLEVEEDDILVSHDVVSLFTNTPVKVSGSHARTVVRECCKGDDESQWERVKFDPPPPKNSLTDGHQNLCT